MEDAVLVTLYYFLSSRILILNTATKRDIYGTDRWLNPILNRIDTSQDKEEEAGPSAKHGHTELIAHRMG